MPDQGYESPTDDDEVNTIRGSRRGMRPPRPGQNVISRGEGNITPRDATPPLVRKVDTVFSNLELLESEISALVDRLRPVMLSVSADEEALSMKELDDRADQSPVSDMLDELASRVRRARSNLIVIQEQLDL